MKENNTNESLGRIIEFNNAGWIIKADKDDDWKTTVMSHDFDGTYDTSAFINALKELYEGDFTQVDTFVIHQDEVALANKKGKENLGTLDLREVIRRTAIEIER